MDKVNMGVTMTICQIRASQQNVKHHNRRLNFRFYMSNKKIKIICTMSRVILRPYPFANCHIFSDPSLPWSVKYFMHSRKTFITRHSVIQRCSRPEHSVHAGCYSPIQELCLCWPLRLDTPCTWIYYPCHQSSRRDDLRLSCLLTQARMPLERIASLNDAI